MARYIDDVVGATATMTRGLDSMINSRTFSSLDSTKQAFIRSVRTNPEGFLDTMVSQADKFTDVFKKMDSADFKKFYGSMSDSGKRVFRNKIEAIGETDLLRKLDDVDGITDATRRLADAADEAEAAADAARRSADDAASFSKRAKQVDLTMPNGSKKNVKYGSEEFWKSIRLGAIFGAGYGLLMWIDNKFKEKEEEYKNCMAGCLPHNWDEYEYGNLEKSDLTYSTPETLEQYQITPIDGQPYCKAEMDDCEEFCDMRCEEESEDVRIPLIDPLRDLTREGAESLGDIFKALFGDLFEGMGLDTSMVGYASSASSSMIMMIMVIMLLK